MAFDYTNLYPDTSGNGGFTKSWNYTTLDPVILVSAVGYFNICATRLAIGDNIFVSVVDHFEPRTRTTLYDRVELFVISIVAGVVTTQDFSSSGGTVPDPPDTSVQFNDAGAFGGEATFTFNKVSGLVTLPTLRVTTGFVDTPEGAAVGAGVPLDLSAGDGGVTSGNGGAVYLQAGSAQGAGYGGDIHLIAGEAVGSASQQGGDVFIDSGGGDNNGDAGDIVLTGGRGGFTNGAGGTVSLIAGGAVGGGDGGEALFTSGDGAGAFNGGNVEIAGGEGGATGNGAPILLTAGRGGATSGNGGAVTITSGAGVAGGGSGGNITITPGAKNGAGVVGHVLIATLENFADDVAAAAGGVPITGFYRTASAVKVRVT